MAQFAIIAVFVNVVGHNQAKVQHMQDHHGTFVHVGLCTLL